MAIFYTDSASFSDVSVSGDIIVSGTLSFTENSGGLTGSLLGTATTASYVEFDNVVNKPSLVSSSQQINTGSFSGSITTASFATTASYVEFDNVANKPTLVSSSLQINTGSFSGSITTASYAVVANTVNALTTLTASNIQLNGLTDTTATNKVLVLDTSTNQIFTTASVGGGGGSGNGFPYDGTVTPAIITGSLIVSGSQLITGSLQVVGAGITGSVYSGSLMDISEVTLATSGTIAAIGTTTVTLDLNAHNFFSVSASAAGTVTWVISNPPGVGRAQTFVLEYTNGGIKTNNWFTGTRWPAGSAPVLTTGTAPDLLGFVTDDQGTNWRGVLLQRGSA